nr:FG-GAP-like repeat-containing protein [Calditrichia bacterium]
MRFFVFVAITLGILLNSCGKEPRISPETAREMIVQRNLGMAYLEEEKPQEAAEAFEKLIALAPEEPLGYANLGLSQLRLANYAQAEKWLTTAVEKAPDNPDIRVLLATAYKLDNQQEKAVETLKTSLKNNPTHLQSNYLLAQLYLESGNPQEAAGAEPLLNAVLETLPANVAARLQLCDLYLARQQGGEALQQLETIRQVLPVLPDKAQSVFDNSIAALQAGKTADAAGQARAFHNLLKATPFYKAALAELTGTLGTAVGNPLQRFASDIVFSGESGKTVPDFLSFTEVSDQNSVPPAGQSDGGCLTSGDFDGDGDVDLFLSRWNATSGRSERLILINQGGIFLPGSPQKGFDLPGRDVAAFTADIDNDGYLDIFVGNDRRNLLFLNEGAGTFREVNQTAGLLTSETVRAAVFADLDLEGDLDVFLATDGQNHLFRNNGDGTFSDVSDETGIEAEALPSSGVDFADFDDDGDPDLVVCNRDGENRYYDNLRQSFFRENGRLVNLSDRNNSAALAVA